MKYLAILFMFFLIACENVKHIKSSNLIEIECSEIEEIPFIQDSILSDFFILKLETPDGIFLGSIDKLVFTKNRIFIADNKMLNSVFIFDLFGQYVNHLEGGNKGPGEFINPISISADYNSDQLCVFDDKLKKLLIYDPQGKFLSEAKMDYPANDLAVINYDCFAFNSGYPQLDNKVNSFDLIYTSTKGKVIDKYLPLKEWRSGTIFNKSNAFTSYNDTVWYCPVYNDTVYLVEKSGIQPFFRFKMNDRFINDKLARTINIDDQAQEYTHSISNFLKTSNTVFIEYGDRDKKTGRRIIQHVFYDMSSQHVKSSQFLIGPGISDGLFTRPIATNGEYFVGCVDAFQAKISLEFKMSRGQELSSERMNLYLNLSENDNPLLLFYKIAPF